MIKPVTIVPTENLACKEQAKAFGRAYWFDSHNPQTASFYKDSKIE